MSTELIDALTVDEGGIDFRGFAANPLQGPDVIDGDGEEVAQQEATKEVIEQRSQVTAQPAQKKAEPKPETRQAVNYTKAETTHDAPAAKVEHEAHEEARDEPQQRSLLDDEPAKAAEPDWSQNGFAKGFLNDVADMGFDAAADLHDQQLAQIKDTKPGLFDYLMAESAKLTNA